MFRAEMWLRTGQVTRRREPLMFEIWTRGQLISLRRMNFEHALAALAGSQSPEGAQEASKAVENAKKALVELLIPGSREVRDAQEKKNKAFLQKFIDKPFRLSAGTDDGGNLGVTLEQ